MDVKIKSLNELEAEEINFLRASTSAKCTQTYEHAKYSADVFNIRAFFVIVRKRKILATMLFYKHPIYYRWLVAKMPYLIILNKLPFALSISAYNMPAFAENLNEAEREKCFKHILKAISGFGRTLNISFYEINEIYKPLLSSMNFNCSQRATYVTDLSRSEDVLWNAIHKNVRTAVRKAEKDGMMFKEVQNLNNYYRILKEDGQRTKKLFFERSKNFIKKVLGDKCLVFGVFKKNTLLAAQCVLVHNKFANIAALARSDLCYEKKYTAGEYLQWKSILALKRKGVLYYDMSGVDPNPKQGSKAHGIKKFKSQFAGKYTTYINCSKTGKLLKHIRK